MITKSKIFEVFEDKPRRKLYTIKLTPGKRVYEESLVKQNNIEYREWDPYSSKLASLILSNCSNIFLRNGKRMVLKSINDDLLIISVADKNNLAMTLSQDAADNELLFEFEPHGSTLS